MNNSGFDVSQLDPYTRRQLLDTLRQNLGSQLYQSMLQNSSEDDLLSFAIQTQLDQGDRGLLGTDVLRDLRLKRMRQRMGEAQYNAFLRAHSEAELLELESKVFAPASTSSERRVRTRESTQKLNQVTMLIALAYGALLGAGYPDWAGFGRVFDAIFYWVVGIIFVIGLILVLFFRTSFDFGNILLLGLVVAALISSAIGLVANLFTIGLKVLGVAGLAWLGAYLVGLLVGRPVFRWLERQEKSWVRWVFGILAVIIALAILTAGWFGVMAVFPI